MEVKASAKFIKISPRKVRLLADLVRGMELQKALDQLNFANKNAAGPMAKLINSAAANALNNFDLDKNNLFIKELRVNGGPTLHRWTQKARGRATPIRKRTSHIHVILGELVDSGERKVKTTKIEAPVKLGALPKEDDGIKIKAKDSDKKSTKESVDEKGKKIVDPRGEGKGKHAQIEGMGSKGFASKIFRRKSG